MYRLAIYDDRVIQRIVSNEVARGFLRCLGIFHAVEKIEITDEVVTHLWETFENHVENTGGELKVAKDAMETLVAPKVARMYEELIDEEYEYTFDEFGEYIMALFIEYSEDMFESFWCQPRIMEELYIRKFFEKEYENIVAETGFEDIDKKTFVEEHIHAVTRFACMGVGEYDFDSVLFFDTDYLFIDEVGGGNLLLTAENMGFVSGIEDREPVSGSLKMKIGEEK